MLWARKREPEAPAAAGVVATPLAIELDPRLFERHFKSLLAAAEDRGGIEAWLDALGEKQRQVAVASAEGNLPRLIDLVFGARRKLGAYADHPGLTAALAVLRDASIPLAARIDAMRDAAPAAGGGTREDKRADARLRRATHDLAAEILHFLDPVRVPLMTRWVWDRATMSGSLRELATGGESVRELPLDNSPGTYESARRWVQERVAAQGIFRDPHFWADLVLAAAYGHYFRAMTGGTLGADFQRASHPSEQITGLLGIDRILARA